jgi:peroxiredoxin Q/BCP
MLQKGDQIPDRIQLYDHDGKFRQLSEFKGKRSVYYVYPKNFTPGCITEAQHFRDAIKEYKNANIQIIGISADTPESHRKFKAKYKLPFTLLSDPKKIFLNTSEKCKIIK